jgi:large subunit ribosomal protein L30
MAETSKKKIFVKWVRSGIGFPKGQKIMPRSLGLRRLQQVVACPDTPQVRGLIQQVHHLVEVVGEPKPPAWLSVPEYTILPAEIVEKPGPKVASREVEGETGEAAAGAEAKPSKEMRHHREAPAEPAKHKKAAKHAAAKEKGKARTAEASVAKKKGKSEAGKSPHKAKKTGKK